MQVDNAGEKRDTEQSSGKGKDEKRAEEALSCSDRSNRKKEGGDR